MPPESLPSEAFPAQPSPSAVAQPDSLGLTNDVLLKSALPPGLKAALESGQLSTSALVQELSRCLAFWQAVTQAVNSSLILEDIFDALAEVLAETLSFDQAVMAILDPSQNSLQLLVRFDHEGLSELDSQSFHRRAFNFSGQDPLLLAQIQQPKSRYYQARNSADQAALEATLLLEAPLKQQMQAAYVVPLLNKGVLMGALALFSQTPIAEETQWLLEQSTNPIAIAVENARFYVNTQRKASQEFLINQLTKAIRQSLEIKTVLSTAVRELGQVLGASRCLIYAFDAPVLAPPQTSSLPNASPPPALLSPPKQTQVFEYTAAGIAPRYGSEASTSPHSGAGTAAVSAQAASPPKLNAAALEQEGCWQILKHRLQQANQGASAGTDLLSDSHGVNPFVLDDVADLPAEHPLKAELLAQAQASATVQSMVLLPIWLGQSTVSQGVVGLLVLQQCHSTRPWLPEDLQLLQAMTEHLGVALGQAKLFGELEQQRDSLKATLAELQQAQMYLVQSEKMAVLGQFVAGIAHEVNTPLGSMLSNNSTLKQSLKKLSAELAPFFEQEPNPLAATRLAQPKRLGTLLELLDINELAGDRIQEIVKNLRNFARLDESDRKRVDLHEGLRSTLVLLRGTLPGKLTLHEDYAPDLPQLDCYPGLLNQVFMNLLVNAIHATEELDHPEIWLTTEWKTAEQSVHITVRDNGKGIEPEHLGRLFDPGFTTKGVGVGTGLGLALCYRIIQKHGGEIQVESQVGEGAAFKVVLPLKSD